MTRIAGLYREAECSPGRHRSNDARLLPLAMRVSLYYLPLVVELSRWCNSASRCGLWDTVRAARS